MNASTKPHTISSKREENYLDWCEERLAEHRELQQEVDEIRRWWSQVAEMGRPNFYEMAMRLRPFRAHLAAHFESEEQGGYMSDVVRAAPRLQDRVNALQRQHSELLWHIDSLIERLEGNVPFEYWCEAETAFQDLVRQLAGHENGENELMRRALVAGSDSTEKSIPRSTTRDDEMASDSPLAFKGLHFP